jgi:non-specific riboncleoside hydrolase
MINNFLNFKMNMNTFRRIISLLFTFMLLTMNNTIAQTGANNPNAALKHKILLDTDPGIDDAAAIAIALTDEQFDVKLLTTVAGNVGADKTCANALKLVEFFGKQNTVPVAAGAGQPLLKPFEDASYVHGGSGMPGWDFPPLQTRPLAKHAVEAMRDVLLGSNEALTLVLTGAYTNAALLFRIYPEVKTKIARIVVMGGALGHGNMSSAAEFNVYTDPHAAKIVFESGLPIVMIGLDITMKALLTTANIERLATLNETGKMLHSLISYYKDESEGGKPMHDVNTLFYLAHPEAFKITDYWVDVVTEGFAIGETVADVRRVSHDGATNVSVATDIDAAAFNEWYMSEIAKIKKEKK